jgi:glyoxylase-like metal-dependent hydrolase (beta-lactamase superfamily II)
MAELLYEVYVAPAKPVVSDDLPPGESQRMWSPTSSTLIRGKREAVLVDPLLTIDESRALADWVAATDSNVSAIFVTHAHGDHFFGASAILDRFPDAQVVAAPWVAARMTDQWAPRWWDGFWSPRFPGQISDEHPTPQPLIDGTLSLDGHELQLIELGHTDTDATSALYDPETGLVVAGDAVYGDVHLYLAESQGYARQAWLDALDTLEQLRPAAVVSGHKRDGDPDSPQDIDRTRLYIQDFNTAAENSSSRTDLYEAMVEQHPSRLNRGALWASASAVMS